MQTILKSQNLGLLADIPPVNGRSQFDSLLEKPHEVDPFPLEIIALLYDGQRTGKQISLNECEVRGEWLYYRDRHYVPKHDDELWLYLLQQHHDVPSAGHCGQAKAFELIARDYTWFGMRKDVPRYIRNCHACQRSRTPRHRPSGILRLLPIPNWPRSSISMDFVTGLPWSDRNDAIWGVVDRLTKTRHFVSCRTTTSAPDLANLFLHHVWKLHGLPKNIISDRGPQFASDFWQQLCSRLVLSPHLSMAFHPETDGQTERANQTMEQILRAFVSHQQDDWSQWLPIAEFAANNQLSETSQVTPFLAYTGCHPRCFFDLAPPTHLPGHTQARETATKLHEIHELVRAKILCAQAKQQEYADRSRAPAPVYRPGDKVWLNARNITSRCPSFKLDHKCLVPFPVTALIGKYACHLDLPATTKVHNVFHVRLLEPAASDPSPGQILPPALPIEVDGEEEWEVAEVLDSGLFRRRLQYLVKWTGYNDPTWEPAASVNGLQGMELFHQRYPEGPGSLPE